MIQLNDLLRPSPFEASIEWPMPQKVQRMTQDQQISKTSDNDDDNQGKRFDERNIEGVEVKVGGFLFCRVKLQVTELQTDNSGVAVPAAVTEVKAKPVISAKLR
jgi:hypothetical protein